MGPRFAAPVGTGDGRGGSALGELLADDGEDGRGFVFRFAPGDAEDAVAGGDQFAGSSVVALEGDLDAVVLAAVGFDDEAGVLPEEVDLEDALRGLDRRVEAGQRQTGGGDSGRSFASKRLRKVAYFAVSATGRQWSRTRRRQGAPRRFGPFGEDRVDPGEVQQPLRRRPLDRFPQLLFPVDPGQVDDRPRHARDRDPVDVAPFGLGRDRGPGAALIPSIRRPRSHRSGSGRRPRGAALPKPSSAAALRCEITDPGQASAAARIRARGPIAACPKAKTPRKTGRMRPVADPASRSPRRDSPARRSCACVTIPSCRRASLRRRRFVARFETSAMAK